MEAYLQDDEAPPEGRAVEEAELTPRSVQLGPGNYTCQRDEVIVRATGGETDEGEIDHAHLVRASSMGRHDNEGRMKGPSGYWGPLVFSNVWPAQRRRISFVFIVPSAESRMAK